ncbi:glycosyltransferase [Thermodesulfobacteriota bacterium]
MGGSGAKNRGPGNQPVDHDTASVAILGTMPPIRALSSYCLELAQAIAELGRVQFISFKKIYPSAAYPGGDLRDDHTFPSITHINLKINRRLTWYNPLMWIIEGLGTRADLLHAQWWSLPLFPVYGTVCLGFRLRRKPVVFTVHNVLPHEKSIMHDLLVRALFKMGDHFIVHSASNRLQLIQHYGISPEQVTEIPHGPLDFHVQSEDTRDLVRREMGFDDTHRVILLFGAIRPYKGIETALKAFGMILETVPDARLLIAGKPWEPWEPYQRWIDELGIEKYVKTHLHYIPSGEVHRFFEASDLVVLPYRHFDSQSGVGATAVSFRKPMVVTDTGGLSELVGDRRNVVPPGDPNAMAQAVAHALKDPAMLEKMAADTGAVAKSMAWPMIAKKTWSIYCKVLGYEKLFQER